LSGSADHQAEAPGGARDDARLDELFVRYWDDALTPDEADELAARLVADPRARELFLLYSQQAVMVAELPAFAPPARTTHPLDGTATRAEPSTADTLASFGLPTPAAKPRRRLTRRGALGLIGGGLAAALMVGISGRLLREGNRPGTGIRVRDVRGDVTVRDALGRIVPAGQTLPIGATVSTSGLGSSVILSYPDGTGITVAGDSVVTIPDGSHVLLNQGVVSALVPPQDLGTEALSLLTPQVTLAGLSGVLLTLGQGSRATELEVHEGLVSALRPSGEPMAVVRQGETLTVGSDGDHRKRPTPAVPDQFAWNLNEPLPEDWHVGRREATPEGPVVVPASWPDPYWRYTRMYQIRSNKQWTRGFFRLQSDSEIRVRYRVRQAGAGQVCFCVRTPSSTCPYTGMLEWNGTFGEQKLGEKKVGEWDWLTVKAGAMLDNKERPNFGEPWVGFLIIFNTYKDNLGLEVAEFRVSRPGAVCPVIDQ
jgi:ferric-dicitrate binding protein FerR (iron transport regulator)